MAKNAFETLVADIQEGAVACNQPNPGRKDERVRLVAPFLSMPEESVEMIGGDCIMFSMTENIAQALCDLQKVIPDGLDSVNVRVPLSLTFGVRAAENEPEATLIGLGKGDIDDSFIGDGCYPDGITIRVDPRRVSFVVRERVSDIDYIAEAAFEGRTLLDAVKHSWEMSDEAVDEIMEQVFEEAPQRPKSGPKPR